MTLPPPTSLEGVSLCQEPLTISAFSPENSVFVTRKRSVSEGTGSFGWAFQGVILCLPNEEYRSGVEPGTCTERRPFMTGCLARLDFLCLSWAHANAREAGTPMVVGASIDQSRTDPSF